MRYLDAADCQVPMSNEPSSPVNGVPPERLGLQVFAATARGIQEALERGQDDLGLLIRTYGELPELVLWKKVMEDLEVQIRAVLV